MNNLTVEQFMTAKGLTQESLTYREVFDLLEEFNAVQKLENFVFLKSIKSDKLTLIDIDKNIVIGLYQIELPFESVRKRDGVMQTNNDIIEEAESLADQLPTPDVNKIKHSPLISPETTLFELRDTLPTKCFNALLDAFQMMGSTPLSLIAKLSVENLKDIKRLGNKGIAAISDIVGKAGLKFAPVKLNFQHYREILNTKP